MAFTRPMPAMAFPSTGPTRVQLPIPGVVDSAPETLPFCAFNCTCSSCCAWYSTVGLGRSPVGYTRGSINACQRRNCFQPCPFSTGRSFQYASNCATASYTFTDGSTIAFTHTDGSSGAVSTPGTVDCAETAAEKNTAAKDERTTRYLQCMAENSLTTATRKWCNKFIEVLSPNATPSIAWHRWGWVRLS